MAAKEGKEGKWRRREGKQRRREGEGVRDGSGDRCVVAIRSIRFKTLLRVAKPYVCSFIHSFIRLLDLRFLTSG